MSDIFDVVDLFVTRAWRIALSVGVGAIVGLVVHMWLGGGAVALMAAVAISFAATTLGVRWHKRSFPLE